MSLWTLSAYYLEGGTCPIRDWYIAQEPGVQALFDTTLAILAVTEDWEDTKEFKALKGNHVGLGEIRFKLNEGKPPRRFRPVGIWPPTTEHEFILLLGCEKNRGVYNPPSAFTLALRYKRDLEAGIGEIHDYR